MAEATSVFENRIVVLAEKFQIISPPYLLIRMICDGFGSNSVICRVFSILLKSFSQHQKRLEVSFWISSNECWVVSEL